MATAKELQTLYVTYFGRPADPEGLQYWLQNGASQQVIADGFATTPEYASSINGKTISQVINGFYQNLFSRDADAAGLAFWTGKVNDFLLGKPGGISLQQVGRFIADGALIQPVGSPDRVILESKLTASANWTSTVASNATFNDNYNGALANTFGVEFLKPVVSPATIPSGPATLAAVAAIPPFGTIGLLTPLSATVSEGGSVIFQLTTIPAQPNKTFTYQISGAVTAADFVGGSLTGVVTTDATGVGTLQLTIANDALVEGSESFLVNIQDVATTSSVSILNTTVAAIQVATSSESVNEGGVLTFTITTQNVPVGTQLLYNLSGNGLTSADFNNAPLTGSVQVLAGGTALVTFNVSSDLSTEGPEAALFTVTVPGGPSASVTTVINDTSIGLVPAIQVATSSESVNEGGVLTFTITTQNVPVGTQLVYNLSGAGLTSADFNNAPLTGTAQVLAGGTAVVTFNVSSDFSSEGPETALFTVAVPGGPIATVTTVINDTSIGLVPAIQVATSSESVNEGGVVTFTITTQNVPVGTLLTYVLSGGGITSADVNNAPLIGTTQVLANGTASVTFQVSNDLSLEGPETALFSVQVPGGPAASVTTVFNDTSVPPSDFTLTVNQDIFVQTGNPNNLTFSASVVPGGPFGVGFNTLQNVDSLVGGDGDDQLIAALTSLGGVVVEPLAIRSIETVSITSLNAANTLSLLNSDSVRTLENFSSTSALTFSNIPGQPVPGGLPTVNINGVYLPGASTTLQFQPVALAGIETLNINTSSSGVNVNGGTGAPLRIITGPGIESAVITDAIQVPDFQVDYDLSQLDIPAISISSPNNVRLSTTGGPLGVNGVNLNTTSINGSGITGVFTVDLSGQAGEVSIQGGAGDDLIQGRQGNSTLVGNGGNDSLTTFGGNDSLNGGAGNDTLVAGEGNNTIEAGSGNDSAIAGAGNDNANGGAGNDFLDLGAGNNNATGGEGADTIVTLGGADTLSGNGGDDSISSGAGSDVVNGDAGNDTIDFGTGLDAVSGGLGDDYFIGDLTPGVFNSSDTINGNEGVNTLEITAANADVVANSIGTPFVDNIQILNISETVGADAGSNQVDASLIDSSIATINLFNGTGATPASFTFNSGASTFNLSTRNPGGTLGAAATFSVSVAVDTDNDSLTINGPSLVNYLNGQDLTFNRFDGNSVTINTGVNSFAQPDQTVNVLTTTPTAGQSSRFIFQGGGGITINQVNATAGNLILDFSGINGSPQRAAVVNGIDVQPGNTVSVLGSAGSDTFVGDTAQPNTIDSGAGNDQVTVGSGDDVVFAGIGNDTITPGLGFDNVDGAAGNDRVNVAGTLNRNSAGLLGFGFDTLNGGDGVDTIQLLGLLGDTALLPLVATQGYTASDLDFVSNFEVLELDVVDSLVPGEITVQDLFNFTINGNTIQTVNLTDADGDGLGSALLFNAPTSLVNLGILDTLENVQVIRRLDTFNDSLTVTLDAGADLTSLILNDEETLSFVLNGNTTIGTLFANDLRTLNVIGNGAFIVTNPIVGATQLSVLNLAGFSSTTITLDASVSTVDMTVTGPTGQPLTPLAYQLNLVTGSGNDNISATGFGANTINANAGNDTIQTGDFADLLTGGLGNDSISSGGGNDTVAADQGNDTVDAGAGDDLVFGDLGNIAGNDSLFGGSGNDTLSGGLGADTIDGGIGIDTYASGFTVSFAPPFVQDPANTGQILGQVVNLSTVNLDRFYITQVTGTQSVAASIQTVAAGTANYLYALPLPLFGGSPVTDVLRNIENVDGTNGNDFLIGSGDINTPVGDRNTIATQNRLNGLAGNDTYQGGFGADTFINDAGADVILDLGLIASGGYEQIIVAAGASIAATLGDEWTAGTGIPGQNSINDGEVTINLNGFNADLSNSEGVGLYTINGTLGDESVIGSANADLINGGGGNDTLDGAGGNDTINGEEGDDVIFGGIGDDLLNGGTGADTVFGGFGNDTIFGGPDADLIDGGEGDDSVQGGSEADTVFGGIGNDFLVGFDGNDLGDPTDRDSIDGGLGNDTIQGNDGGDSLFGNLGFDSITGGTGNDSIDGGADNDTIDGGVEDDQILGGAGIDLIQGGLGNDTILGEGDADTIDAGAGLDSVIGGAGNDILNGDEGDDSIFGNENDDTIAGGLGDDSIDGGAASDIIDGGDGADQIFGGSGIDSILGGLGNDTIEGQNGSDTIDAGDGLDSVIGGEGDDSIIGALGADTLFGGLGNDTFTGNDGEDSIVSDEGNDSALGGTGNDTIILGAEADTLFGEAGNDSLLGGAGNDSIDGGADNDSIFAEADDDYVIGGTGNDSIDAGTGNDTVEAGAGTDTIVAGEGDDSVDAGTENDIVTGGLGNDTLFGGAGSDDIVGGDGNDSIDGGGDSDLIKGGTGNDSIFGQAGDDLIAGEAGDDSIDGGTGNDSITGAEGSDFIDGNADNDSIDSGADDDTVEGGAGNDTIFAQAGNDTITGEDGDDSILAGIGNDTVFGDTGNDTILGEAGSDTIGGGAGDDSIDGGFDDDTIAGDAGNDSILGDLGNDVIDGGADNDSVDGGAGDDSILGGTENDSIFGGAGSDTIGGGAGDDSIDGGIDDDTITGDAGADSIFGDAGNDVIDGGTENDSISGGAGDDSILGGFQSDSIFGGAGNDTIVGDTGVNVIAGGNDSINAGEGDDSVLGTAGSDTIFGEAGNDFILGWDGLDFDAAGDNDSIDGGTGNDTIQGNDVADSLFGNVGDDSISGGTGADSIDGGADADSLLGDAGTDTILGAAGNDSIDAGADNDSVNGGADNDSIFGQAGADAINGGTGNDSIDGGANADTLLGDAGTDTILGATGNDSIDAGGDDDTVDGGADDDSIFGQAGADSIEGNTGNDSIDGGADNDTLLGGAGNDTLIGGIGNDSLVGGADNDSYVGGAGIDTFIVSEGADQISDLGVGGLNEIVQVSAGASVTATLGANWTATASSINNGTSGTINTADAGGGLAYALNLSAITGVTGWTVNGVTQADNVVGSNYNDSISGNAGADTIDGFIGNDTIAGGTQVDLLTGGIGADVFVQNAGDSLAPTASMYMDAAMSLADGDSITFGGGVDIVTDFVSTADKLDWTGPGSVVALASVAMLDMDGVSGNGYWAFGNYVANSFIFSATGSDVFFFQAGGTNLSTDANITSGIVLDGGSASWNAATNII